METIECDVVVDEKHQALLQLPSNISPGQHRLVVTVNEMTENLTDTPGEEIPVLHVGSWPDRFSLRREDIYGDDAR